MFATPAGAASTAAVSVAASTTATAGAVAAASTAAASAVAVAAFAVAGLPAGATARLLLARLRRGARVPPGWCEAAVAALWALSGAAWRAGALPFGWLPVLLGLGWLAVAAAAVDVLHHRLPDALTLPALPGVLLLLLPLGPATVLRAAAGAAVLSAAHALVHLVVPRALGAGDVKLAAPLGAVLAAVSWASVPLGALLAAVITGSVAVVGLARGVLARDAELPHGPSMLAAGWLVVAGTGATAGTG
ncbi:prepilin peptidase [Pseudonocardia bannensis]|uniref:Prepilin peptidase n=1 Tax=Pseudonocardia bannensis TaxID=630973 RepID=A0A848DEC7_9PSEU|nr:A24 family peptidase [Pseudonocardia bannensis]NMH90925.1 prepilin peptidase [Pseudonocardia bannensis]